MANEKKSGRKRKVSRQTWKPNRLISALYSIWTAVYGVLKVCAGAVITVAIIGIVCAAVFVGVLADYLEGDIIPQAGVQLEGFDLDEPSYIYYIDNTGNIQIQQKLYADTDSDWVSYEDIPEDLIHAAVAIEDKRFFEHQGVDWFTTVKACVNMFVGSGDQFGGSSITQQLIKNLLLKNDKSADDVTVQRKVLEIFRATEFERRYDKKIVLEWYLNMIYLGNRCDGVKAAAAKYFGKELEFLTPAECATLISITNNPSLFDPYRVKLDSKGLTGMEQNKIRRENTLWVMRNEGYLTEEEYQEALSQEIILKNGIDPMDKVADCPNQACRYHGKVGSFEKREDGKYYCPVCGQATTIGEDVSQRTYSWFVDTVLEDLAQTMAEKAGIEWGSKDVRETYMNLISKGGYHIYSTLNMDVQQQVDKIYQDLSQIPETASVQQLQSGIVVIDNRTGDIVAMAGGVGKDKGFDDYNRATEALLQPGSAIKPLTVYGPAFELGIISPASIGTDMPLMYLEDPENPEKPKPFPRNDERQYGYSRNILHGVVSSVNAIAVNTLNTMGLEYSFNFAKDKFGLEYLTKHYEANGIIYSDVNLSPLGMGAPTIGVTVRQMAAAFATYANKGTYRDARTFTHVYNSDGELVLTNGQTSRDILSQKTVDYMNYCMDSAVEGGTGWAADIPGQNVAGKTGTTSSKRDRWFCGFTDYYTAAVWCGYDTPEVVTLTGPVKVNPACQLFKKVMAPIHEGKPAVKLYDDSKFVDVALCLDSGKLATEDCAHDVRGSRIQYGKCYPEDIPTEKCDKHVSVDYCEHGVACEYCKKFADAGVITLTKKSLVKMTQKEVDEIVAAGKNGLYSSFLRDDYIFLVDERGRPARFTGLNGDINVNSEAPYLECDIHTKEKWEEYLKNHPDLNPPDPTDGSKPHAPEKD